MQIKTITRDHCTLIEMIKIKMPAVNEVGKQLELWYIAGRNVIGKTTLENCLAVSAKTRYTPILAMTLHSHPSGESECVYSPN
jgi:hypothetical protein